MGRRRRLTCKLTTTPARYEFSGVTSRANLSNPGAHFGHFNVALRIDRDSV